MADIQFQCPVCKKSVEVPEELANELIDCPRCKGIIDVAAARHPLKAEAVLAPQVPPRPPLKPQPVQATEQGNLNTILGIVGSLILVLGVFSPLLSMPVMGTLNYFQNGKGDGVIVLILAVVSLLLSVSRRYRGLWFTGLASGGLLAFTFINFQMRFHKMETEMKTKLADNPFGGVASLVTEAVQMQWGWAVLIVGILLILVAAAFKPQKQVEQ